MISLELSMVHHNRAESARLAAAMEEFLSRGGQITEKAGPIPVPRPYGYSSAVVTRQPPAPRKTETRKALRVVPDIEEARAKKRADERNRVAQVREMAKTMRQRDVAAATGIPRKRLHSMALAYGFEFQVIHDKADNLVFVRYTPEQEAKMVERITALLANGVSQRQTFMHLGISSTLLRRLIRDYAIPVPAKG
jgi:hypothetical protein